MDIKEKELLQQIGMLPKNCTIKSESIIDEFGILLTLNLGDYTYEKAI